jgi:hypothetical protein
MGYKPSGTTFLLDFQEFEGLEVTTKSAPLGRLLDMAATPLDVRAQNRDALDKVMKFFLKRVVTWNIEHPEIDKDDEGNVPEACPVCGLAEGQLLPVDIKYVYCLELTFITSILFGWMSTIARVSAPKGMSGSDGESNIQEAQMRQLGDLQSPLKLPEPNFS